MSKFFNRVNINMLTNSKLSKIFNLLLIDY